MCLTISLSSCHIVESIFFVKYGALPKKCQPWKTKIINLSKCALFETILKCILKHVEIYSQGPI